MFVVANSAAGLAFHPALAVAVFGILDVLTGMEKRVAIKAPIDISRMRYIMPGNNSHESVVFSYIHLASKITTCTPIRWCWY